MSSREKLPFFISDYCLIKYFRTFLIMAHYFFQNYEMYILYCIVRKSENQDRNSCYNCKENVLNTYTFFFKSYCCLSTHIRTLRNSIYRRIHLELSNRRSFFDDANRKTKIKETAFFIMLKTHNVKQNQPYRHLSDLIRDLHVTE